jgi:hypothetical protein
MNISRISVFAICFAVGLAVVSDPSMARSKWKSKRFSSAEQLPSSADSNSSGYPNGRPFQAIEYDFDKLFYRFDMIDTDLDQIAANLIRVGQAVVRVERNTETIDQNLIRVGQAVVRVERNTETILEDIAGINDDVALLNNTLEVQVSAKSATDTGVTLYVQVIRNGIGLEQLPRAAFTYGNSFPLGAEAEICEVNCFEEGVGSGLYAIKLVVNESDQTFAGTLMVEDRDGAGTSLVTFDIPAAPVTLPVEPAV